MDARAAGADLRKEFGGPDRQSAERHTHTFVGSTQATLTANIALTTDVVETSDGRVRVTSAVDNFGAGHDFREGSRSIGAPMSGHSAASRLTTRRPSDEGGGSASYL